MSNKEKIKRIIPETKTVATIVRMAIGWHFLYEGLVKVITPDWSSESFLSNTIGFTSGFYHWLVSSPEKIQAVDLLNVYGLVFTGLALFLGIAVRWASLAGMSLLVLYYCLSSFRDFPAGTS